MRPARPVKDRFFEKVEKQTFISSPHVDTPCWIWTAFIHPNGYGMFDRAGKLQKAHRASWIINKGEIPEGLWVLHRCDNRKCVNPDHLFLGSMMDNINDCCNKKRQAVGEKQAQSKLTKEQVLEIRKSTPNKRRELSNKFGVTWQAIHDVMTGRTWKHLTAANKLTL